MKNIVTFAIFAVLTFIVDVQADPTTTSAKRGLVTSARCPFTCEMAKIDQSNCRQWQTGDDCHVEDLTQAPGHRSVAFVKEANLPGKKQPQSRMRRDATGTWIDVSSSASATAINTNGLVTSAQCPFSCADEGLSAEQCREWNMGDVCFVEDLTQAPGHRSMLRVPK